MKTIRLNLALFLLSSVSPLPCLAETKPNVVILLADDAGWGDFGHSGNTLVETPRIASLACEGVSLERFYVCQVCAPTRADFLTGRYHGRTGISGVSAGQERLNLTGKTMADTFRAAGYTCLPADAGFVVELSFNGLPLGTVEVEPAWDPPLFKN